VGADGEGLARSFYNESLYGPALHRAFKEVKGLFDPHNRLNPGKIVAAPAPWQPDILRFHPNYRTPLAPSTTWLDFGNYGGMAGLVEKGAQAVILGCTEIGLLVTQGPVPLIDTTAVHARAAVALALDGF